MKVAERVSGYAVIPAINELRYSARQLVAASALLRQADLNQHDKVTISRRMWVGDQYLRNADHDIVDAIVGFCSASMREVEQLVPPGEIAIHFPEYPKMRATLLDAQDKIGESRTFPLDRDQAYKDLREGQIAHLIANFFKFEAAGVKARAEWLKLKRKDQLRARFTNFVEIVSILAFLYAVFATDRKVVEKNWETLFGYAYGSSAEPAD